MAGWLRTSIIFILSGIGGNLWSSILIPYEPEVTLNTLNQPKRSYWSISSDVYLGSFEKSVMELFCENSERLKAVTQSNKV